MFEKVGKKCILDCIEGITHIRQDIMLLYLLMAKREQEKLTQWRAIITNTQSTICIEDLYQEVSNIYMNASKDNRQMIVSMK